MSVKIYKLVDPFTNEVKYIGKTNRTLTKRLWEHIKESKYELGKRNHKQNWIMQVLALGKKPKIELIKEVNESEWEEEERAEIFNHKKNHKLTNISGGGSGGDVSIRRQVAKVDYLTLGILKKYESLYEAECAEGISYTRIIDSCSGRKLVVAGYLWRYLDDESNIIHPKNINASNKRKIGKFDLKMNLISIYPNLESTNQDPAGISKACKGKCKTINGYIWRFLDLYNNIIVPKISYKNKTVSKMNMEGNVIDVYENARKASFSIEDGNEDLIIKCCKGRGQTHRGFKWRYNNY